MSDLARKPRRLQCAGVSLASPVDDPSLWERGKFPILTNLRAYSFAPIETRGGLTSRFTTALAPVHSMVRLSDPLAGLNPIVVGAYKHLYWGITSPLTDIDTGAYSGNPLSFVQFQPDQSPSPWVYVGDLFRMRKVSSDGTNYPIGIAPPTFEPTAVIGAASTKDVDGFQATTNWSADNTILDNAALSTITRINTTVTAAIGDVGGGGAGWYTITPADISNILPGTFVTFGTTGGGPKFVQVVRAQSFTTTVASITYDSGVTGPCSIQPTASVYLDQYSMLHLNASEYVTVQSVTYAPDGTVQSFRCTTVGTISAGQAIAGVPSFRVNCDAAPTGTVTRSAMRAAFKTVAAGGVGYIAKSAGLANSDLSQVSNRQLGPNDELACGFRMSNLNTLVEIKFYLNVDPSDLTGQSNAYMWTMRPADIQKIINDELTAIQAQNTQLTNSAIGTVVGSPDNSGSDLGGPLPKDLQPMVGNLAAPDTSYDPTGTPIGGGGGGGTGSVPQGTLGTVGNGQWVQVRLKFSDAVRIGSAAGLTLQSVTALRISVNVTAVTSSDTIDFDAWWVGGTYGPDVGDIGSGYVYRLRGRDTRTGAQSNPGPAMRLGGAVYPRRQAVSISFSSLTTAANASWKQCNRVDVERYGGSDTNWRWLGSVTNDPATASTLTFTDIYPDDWIANQPILPTNLDQPFVIVGAPLAGTCDISGTSVTIISGDTLPLTLAAGNLIQIGNEASVVNYTTHNVPSGSAFVELEMSGGSQTGVSWVIPAPRIYGTPLPYLWGPLDNFMLACGDKTNPGRLYWANGNNPDAHDQASYIDVTPPSEPLQGGCMWDSKAFAWSTDRKFAVYPTFEGAILTGTQILGGTTQLLSPFRAIPIPNSKGLYTPWAFAVGDKFMYQLERDGISQDSGGPSESITDADLYPWFPHDGQPGKTVNGYAPPDLLYSNLATQPSDFRLAWAADWLYFDYRATDGTLHTAAYDCIRKSWWLDGYGRTVVGHYNDQGTKDADFAYIGAASNHLYAMGTNGAGLGCIFECVGADDDGVAIASHLRTPSDDQGEPWLDKQWEDSILDCDRGGQSLTVTPGVNNYSTTIAATTISTSTGRQQYLISGADTLGRNLALDVAWSGSGPALYIWEPSFLPHSYLHATLATVVEANGKPQYQFLRDGWLAYYADGAVTLTVIADGVTYTYTLPTSGSLSTYTKQYIVFSPVKAKSLQFKLTGPATGLRFINGDSWVRLRGWAEPGPLTTMPIPFQSAGERA